MLSNFSRALANGARTIVRTPLKGLGMLRTVYNYLGIAPLVRLLPGFGIPRQVTCRARAPVIHKNQECQYVSSKCYKNGFEIIAGGRCVLYKGEGYPISPLLGNNGEQIIDLQGNKLFAINTAGGNNCLSVDSKLGENKVLVLACNGNRCVDPVPGKGSRKVLADFKTTVHPFSFSVVNNETKQTDWLLSLLMLPFNVAGLVVGCVGRLAAGVLGALAKCCKVPAKYLAEKVDRHVVHSSSGVLQGGKTPYVSAALVCVLSILGNLFSTASSVVKNSADFTEAVVRSPSAIVNGIHNENMKSLPVRAGMQAIVDPIKQAMSDLKGSSIELVKTCTDTKARFCADGKYLRSQMSGARGFIQESHAKDLPQQEKQSGRRKISRADLEAVGDIGRDLASQISYGAESDVNTALKQRKGVASSKGL